MRIFAEEATTVCEVAHHGKNDGKTVNGKWPVVAASHFFVQGWEY